MRIGKNELRKKILEIRDSMSDELVEEKSRAIAERFLNLFGSAERFLLYMSIKNEVRTNFLVNTLFSNGKKLFLPKYFGGEFIPIRYEGPLSMLKGMYGVMEPLSDESCDEFDVIVIPGVVFGYDFNRIGMGKGYYDKMLKKVKGLKVGLAYQFQLVDGIKEDPWDVKMDMIITEEDVYRR